MGRVRNMPQALVGGVDVLAEADRVAVAVRTARGDQGGVVARHVVGLDDERVVVGAPHL